MRTLQRDGDAVLIAAQSGRALAAAARRAGLRPFVADLFGDEDTLALAEGYRPLRGRFGHRTNAQPLLSALDALEDQAGGRTLGVVLGSGFEATPGLIDRLSTRHRLLGAGADVVERLKDPMGLAALLTRLGIPHPPVALGSLADPAGWLLKRRGGSGGSHIRAAGAGTAPRSFYHQRRIPGVAVSLAFLADGRRVQCLDFTRQWTAPSRVRPFRYAGAAAPFAPPEAVARGLVAAVEAIVAVTGLSGLASADALVDGETWWLLEINPRPGATLDILDRRRTPLLLRHIEASLGHLGEAEPARAGAAAAEILYARRTVPLVPPVAWPDYTHDRPSPGSRVAAGAPICTVTAEADDTDAARALLESRVAATRALLSAGKDAGDDDHEHGERPPERQRADGAPRRQAGG